VVKQLLDAGVSLQRARKAIECLRTDLGAEVASASLVLAGPASVLAQTDGEVVDLLRGGQGVLNIVPLAPSSVRCRRPSIASTTTGHGPVARAVARDRATLRRAERAGAGTPNGACVTWGR